MKTILIIDDEIGICESIKLILDYEGYETEYATSGKDGLVKLNENEYSVLLLDIQMPEMNGFEVLKKVKNQFPFISVIIISAHGSLENAIKATKLGAYDFIEKPIDREKLIISTRNAVDKSVLLEENVEIKKSLLGDGQILGKSNIINDILLMIKKVAPLNTRVLITGENGTGKELVARAIHNQSKRKDKPFVEVNCAAIPNELIESELFGHEKGSFTGAYQQRIGRFELAKNGTLFLDEVGDMSPQAQAKVLRAIEGGMIERVGSVKKIEVDVRIIAATNKNLKEEITNKNFREDLYHRLNVIPIFVPPLRNRIEDIPILINHFVNNITSRYNKPLVKFTKDAIELLQTQKWSGNIRELRNVIERIIIIIDKPLVDKNDLHFLFPEVTSSVDDLMLKSNTFQDFKEKTERAFILKQLNNNNWNISKTAKQIDIQRSHLYNKIKKYGIEKGDDNG